MVVGLWVWWRQWTGELPSPRHSMARHGPEMSVKHRGSAAGRADDEDRFDDALRGESFGNGCADSGACAGDQRDLALEQPAHVGTDSLSQTSCRECLRVGFGWSCESGMRVSVSGLGDGWTVRVVRRR